MTFGVVVEPRRRNAKFWIASVPLLPGCTALGRSANEVLAKTQAAIQKHFKRRGKEFAVLLPEIKCRGISRAEYDKMDDAPLGAMAVLVGVEATVPAARGVRTVPESAFAGR